MKCGVCDCFGKTGAGSSAGWDGLRERGTCARSARTDAGRKAIKERAYLCYEDRKYWYKWRRIESGELDETDTEDEFEDAQRDGTGKKP